jgi:hypothetical protein
MVYGGFAVYLGGNGLYDGPLTGSLPFLSPFFLFSLTQQPIYSDYNGPMSFRSYLIKLVCMLSLRVSPPHPPHSPY